MNLGEALTATFGTDGLPPEVRNAETWRVEASRTLSGVLVGAGLFCDGKHYDYDPYARTWTATGLKVRGMSS